MRLMTVIISTFSKCLFGENCLFWEKVLILEEIAGKNDKK